MEAEAEAEAEADDLRVTKMQRPAFHVVLLPVLLTAARHAPTTVLRAPVDGSAHPSLDITWAVNQELPDGVAAGGVAHFNVTWGVDPVSHDAAVDTVLSATAWFGGAFSNVMVGRGGNCSLAAATQVLDCRLGAIAVGAWGPYVAFDVSVPAGETPPHCLPFFLGGLGGFDHGPETFARMEVA